MDPRDNLLASLMAELQKHVKALHEYDDMESVNTTENHFIETMKATKNTLESIHIVLGSMIDPSSLKEEKTLFTRVKLYESLSNNEQVYNRFQAKNEGIKALEINREGEQKVVSAAVEMILSKIEGSDREEFKAVIKLLDSHIINSVKTSDDLSTLHQNLATIKNAKRGDEAAVKEALKNLGVDDGVKDTLKEDYDTTVAEIITESIEQRNKPLPKNKEEQESKEDDPKYSEAALDVFVEEVVKQHLHSEDPTIKTPLQKIYEKNPEKIRTNIREFAKANRDISPEVSTILDETYTDFEIAIGLSGLLQSTNEEDIKYTPLLADIDLSNPEIQQIVADNQDSASMLELDESEELEDPLVNELLHGSDPELESRNKSLNQDLKTLKDILNKHNDNSELTVSPSDLFSINDITGRLNHAHDFLESQDESFYKVDEAREKLHEAAKLVLTLQEIPLNPSIVSGDKVELKAELAAAANKPKPEFEAWAKVELQRLRDSIQPNNPKIHELLADAENAKTAVQYLAEVRQSKPAEHLALLANNTEKSNWVKAESAEGTPEKLFGIDVPEDAKKEIAKINYTRINNPANFSKAWAERQFVRLHKAVSADGTQPNAALHAFMDDATRKAEIIKHLADIRAGAGTADDDPARKITDAEFIKFLTNTADKAPDALFGVAVDKTTKEAIAADNVERKRKREKKEEKPEDIARGLFDAKSYEEVSKNLRISHGGNFDRYQRYALAVSSLENLNRDTATPMPKAEGERHLKNLQEIIHKLNDFKFFLKQVQDDKLLDRADAKKLDASYRKLINGKPDAQIKRLLDQIEKDLDKLHAAKEKLQYFTRDSKSTTERSFGTSYTIEKEKLYSAEETSEISYNQARAKIHESFNADKSEKPDHAGACAIGEKSLGKVPENHHISAFKVTLQDKKQNHIDTASIRTHDTKNHSAKIEFFMPPASEKKLTGTFSGKMSFRGSRLPSMATMEWAAQNIQSLRSVTRLKSQPIRILPTTKKELVDALVLYCKHKGYNFEAPTWYKDKMNNEKVADFGQRWKQDHPEDIGKRTAERLEDRVAPRPGRS